MTLASEVLLDLEKRFSHHAPATLEIGDLHTSVRALIKGAATEVLDLLPYGAEVREVAVFLTKLEEAMMWANAAIARHQDKHVQAAQTPAPPQVAPAPALPAPDVPAAVTAAPGPPAVPGGTGPDSAQQVAGVSAGPAEAPAPPAPAPPAQ